MFDFLINSIINPIIDNYSLLLEGLVNTLILAITGTLLGLVLGGLLAIVLTIKLHYKDSKFKIIIVKLLKGLTHIYVSIFRGTPMMVQAMIFYFGVFANVFSQPIITGIIVVSLNTAAYISQILVGGIKAIDSGQMEGGRSLGLSYSQVMRKIVIPQAFKDTLPSLANMLVLNVKDTSVLSVIAVVELFQVGQQIYSVTYKVDIFIVIALIYFIVTLLLSILIHFTFKERVDKSLDSGAEYESL